MLTMGPIDAVGNPILKGDLVLVVDDKGNTLYGEVADIKEPSVIAPGTKNPMEQLGTVSIAMVPMVIPFDQRNPRIITVNKLVKPPNYGKRQS